MKLVLFSLMFTFTTLANETALSEYKGDYKLVSAKSDKRCSNKLGRFFKVMNHTVKGQKVVSLSKGEKVGDRIARRGSFIFHASINGSPIKVSYEKYGRHVKRYFYNFKGPVLTLKTTYKRYGWFLRFIRKEKHLKVLKITPVSNSEVSLNYHYQKAARVIDQLSCSFERI